MSADPFRTEQRRVARGMAAAAIVSALVLPSAWVWGGRFAPPVAGLAERIAFALQVDTAVIAWLAAGIAAMAAGRFGSAEDIAGEGLGAGGSRLIVRAAVLQNTLEQAILAIAAHMALSSVLRPEELGVLPALALLFGLGRLLFWRGYAKGAGARAFGFGLTFYPSLAALLVAAFLALLRT